MASEYSTWATTLAAWASANLPATVPVIHENDPRPARVEGPVCIISGPHELVQDGPDWVTYEDGSEGQVPTVQSPRRGNWTFRIVTRSQLPRDSQAGMLLEDMRQDLARPARRAALKAANMGFIRASQVLRMDTRWDDRYESVASMGVWFALVYVGRAAADTDADGQIDTVVASSDLDVPTEWAEFELDPV